MSYLIDTNVISELTRKKPQPSVVDWFSQCDSDELHISVLTIGEIRKGITKIADNKREMELIHFLEKKMVHWFDRRILQIDLQVANTWGRICGHAKKPVPAIDSLIAATALSHQLTLVTRNTKDFIHFELEIINPFIL